MKKFIIDFIFINTLLFILVATTALLYFSRDMIQKNNHLIAVQWCKKDPSSIANQSTAWFAVYLYTERNKLNDVIVKGWLINYRVFNSWDPIRYEDTKILGVEKSEIDARRNWGTIICLSNNKALVGRSGIEIKWGGY